MRARPYSAKPVDLSVERSRACADAVRRSGVTCMIGFQRRFDPTFAALKARVERGDIGAPEMLVVTSRDGRAARRLHPQFGRHLQDMLIHDFDVFRWILGDEAQTLHATGSCLTDPAVQDAGDIDSTAVTIRTRRGLLCQINTSRRAAYGYDQRFELLGSNGMLQAGNVRPTEVSAWLAAGIATDVPEPFFLERYRHAYAAEIAHFVDALRDGTPVRTTIDDGRRARTRRGRDDFVENGARNRAVTSPATGGDKRRQAAANRASGPPPDDRHPTRTRRSQRAAASGKFAEASRGVCVNARMMAN